jgi:hypothetical protein
MKSNNDIINNNDSNDNDNDDLYSELSHQVHRLDLVSKSLEKSIIKSRKQKIDKRSKSPSYFGELLNLSKYEQSFDNGNRISNIKSSTSFIENEYHGMNYEEKFNHLQNHLHLQTIILYNTERSPETRTL